MSFAGAKFQHHGGTHPVSFRNTLFEGPVDFSGADFTPEETGAHDKPFQSVNMEASRYSRSGVRFNGATGIGYVKAPAGEPSRLLETQGAALPPTPSTEKVAAWRKDLARVTEQLLKDPSDRASWWKQKSGPRYRHFRGPASTGRGPRNQPSPLRVRLLLLLERRCRKTAFPEMPRTSEGLRRGDARPCAMRTLVGANEPGNRTASFGCRQEESEAYQRVRLARKRSEFVGGCPLHESGRSWGCAVALIPQASR